MSTSATLLAVREIYLHEALVEVLVNGMAGSPSLFKRRIHKKNPGLFLALIAMYILATTHSFNRWIIITHAFIDHSDTPTSTALALIQPPLSLELGGAIVFSTNILISDCVLVIIELVLPIICTLVGTGNYIHLIHSTAAAQRSLALGFRSIADQAAYILNPELDIDMFVDFATPYFILSLVTTLLATLLIVVRILTMSEHNTRRERGYGRVIEIVVESALLYSVTLIIFLPFLIRGADEQGIVQSFIAQMTGIAPTLIVARVSFGLARPDETWQAPSSSLRFHRSMVFGIPSSEPRTTSIGLGALEVNTSSMNIESGKEGP
ncbi:hypothetical protein C8J57DRAFT_1344644 [Mycena rebaudengoi]|nr:hypothetical protein C8J57DRAFT_1344644 [Mycena rebaudengoi]